LPRSVLHIITATGFPVCREISSRPGIFSVPKEPFCGKAKNGTVAKTMQRAGRLSFLNKRFTLIILLKKVSVTYFSTYNK
jgi:hypothetical protein